MGYKHLMPYWFPDGEEGLGVERERERGRGGEGEEEGKEEEIDGWLSAEWRQ